MLPCFVALFPCKHPRHVTVQFDTVDCRTPHLHRPLLICLRLPRSVYLAFMLTIPPFFLCPLHSALLSYPVLPHDSETSLVAGIYYKVALLVEQSITF